jgi:hypothetical protein
MAGITIEQAIDLGQATLEQFKQDDLQMTLKHQSYEVLNQWFEKDKVVLDGGDRVTRHISLRDTGNASHVRMYDVDTPNVANVDETIKVEWTHAKTSFSYSLKELAMNEGNRQRIYNLLKQRHDNAYREFADLLEEAAWRTPTSSSDDLNPFGIPGWLVQPDTDPAEGVGDFTGYLGDYWSASESSMSTVGGIACSSSTNPRWANYYEDHGGKLDSSLLKRLRRSFRKTKFQTPMFAKQAIDPQSNFSKFRLYTNSDVLDELEEIAAKSDDKLGFDLGKYAGATIFKGVPFQYVDVLDDAKQYVYGSDPIFGVNHNHFYAICLSGEYFRVNKPMSDVNQHDVLTVYIDLTYAYINENRRTGGFLISNWETA